MNAAAARQKLHSLANPDKAAFLAKYFKTGPGEYAEGDRFLGLTVPQTRRIMREFRALPLPEVKTLLRSSWHEERLLAVRRLLRRRLRGVCPSHSLRRSADPIRTRRA